VVFLYAPGLRIGITSVTVVSPINDGLLERAGRMMNTMPATTMLTAIAEAQADGVAMWERKAYGCIKNKLPGG
jgi:hypothetical protein